MSKYILALVLIGVGGYLVYTGNQKKESLAGGADKVGTEVANALDGKARQPDYVWYYVGGGVLILGGAVVALRKTAA